MLGVVGEKWMILIRSRKLQNRVSSGVTPSSLGTIHFWSWRGRSSRAHEPERPRLHLQRGRKCGDPPRPCLRTVFALHSHRLHTLVSCLCRLVPTGCQPGTGRLRLQPAGGLRPARPAPAGCLSAAGRIRAAASAAGCVPPAGCVSAAGRIRAAGRPAPGRPTWRVWSAGRLPPARWQSTARRLRGKHASPCLTPARLGSRSQTCRPHRPPKLAARIAHPSLPPASPHPPTCAHRVAKQHSHTARDPPVWRRVVPPRPELCMCARAGRLPAAVPAGRLPAAGWPVPAAGPGAAEAAGAWAARAGAAGTAIEAEGRSGAAPGPPTPPTLTLGARPTRSPGPPAAPAPSEALAPPAPQPRTTTIARLATALCADAGSSQGADCHSEGRGARQGGGGGGGEGGGGQEGGEPGGQGGEARGGEGGGGEGGGGEGGGREGGGGRGGGHQGG